MRYEINEKELRVFDDNDTCFLLQPFHPEGRDWQDRAEIESWVKDYLDNFGKTPVIEEFIGAPTND